MGVLLKVVTCCMWVDVFPCGRAVLLLSLIKVLFILEDIFIFMDVTIQLYLKKDLNRAESSSFTIIMLLQVYKYSILAEEIYFIQSSDINGIFTARCRAGLDSALNPILCSSSVKMIIYPFIQSQRQS